MSDAGRAVSLAKWPFYLADVVLCAIIAFVLRKLGPIEGTTDVVITLGCLLAASWAAWLSITPWLVEHRTVAGLTDSANLKSSLEQIRCVEKVAELIRQSNLQWQNVQDAAGRTVAAAQEISARMKTETEEFMRFLENAHNSERAGLRLEVEKLRRMEGDWIKVAVGILDHVFAITRAAERSGQANLISQMQQFQNACREVARRIGLVPFTPSISEAFDARSHQLPDPDYKPPEGAKIGDILAAGFTYQGQLLRRALVMLEGEDPRAAVAVTSAPAKEPAVEDHGRTAPSTENEPPQTIKTVPPQTAVAESSQAIEGEPSKPSSDQEELPLA